MKDAHWPVGLQLLLCMAGYKFAEGFQRGEKKALRRSGVLPSLWYDANVNLQLVCELAGSHWTVMY